jgi:Kef-type K+ transport system membrane component KefB
MILAGITTLVRPDGASNTLAVRLLFFAGYLAAMVIVGRPMVRWVGRRRGIAFGESADDLAMVLLVVLLSAVATDWLGVHALFGAFFAGLIMPREAHVERLFEERIEPLTMALLLPLFFAFSGLRTNVQLIDNPAHWRDAALILGVAIAGKAGASTIAARAMGSNWRDAGTLGFLLNTRGLVELVVLNIGLDLGILSPIVFSMLVVMALVTTFMTSPAVRWLRAPEPAAVSNRQRLGPEVDLRP